ncbi:DUF2809 domain-containing protein [Mucilaginibacter ximonensis]|uniref:DUF2809 domain-containing protein n=1 Tax=Mucilaginibacter ximonensis TaxID=538021 RepID=A0ABW5YBC9_9SPHI
MRFNFKYLIATVILFLIELFIGFYMHDDIVRPFVGDLLVVIFIYCFVMSFFKINSLITALGTLFFAYATEISQYYHLVNMLGWGGSKFARIIMGTSFSWIDMLMYTAGISLVVIIETLSGKPVCLVRA